MGVKKTPEERIRDMQVEERRKTDDEKRCKRQIVRHGQPQARAPNKVLDPAADREGLVRRQRPRRRGPRHRAQRRHPRRIHRRLKLLAVLKGSVPERTAHRHKPQPQPQHRSITHNASGSVADFTLT